MIYVSLGSFKEPLACIYYYYYYYYVQHSNLPFCCASYVQHSNLGFMKTRQMSLKCKEF